MTTGQNVILINVAEAKPRQLLPEPHAFFRGLVDCTGSDYCNLALIETKDVAKKLADAISARASCKHALVRMSAGCGNHLAANVGFQGGQARIYG